LRVAVKILRVTNSLDPREIEKARIRTNREVVAWQSLDHPNVLPFLGIASLSNQFSPPGLVSPWIQRSDVLKWIGRHSERKHEKAQEIAAGLEYLHKNKIVHGDLKIDNVMISDDYRAQISDFGIARIVGVVGFTTVINSNFRFAAPELMPTKMDSRLVRPTFESDIYSLALLFLQLFHGPDNSKIRGLPYNHISNDAALVEEVVTREGRPLRDRYNRIADQHWNVMKSCWTVRPDERPSITQVCCTLRALSGR